MIHIRSFAIFGSSGSPCELSLIRKLFTCDFYKIVFVDTGYLNDVVKGRLKSFEALIPCEISFARPEDLPAASFDMFFCVGTCFRQISPKRYTPDNQELASMGFCTRSPLISDRNRILPFGLSQMEVLRFGLNLLKVGGVAIVRPAFITYDILSEYDHTKAFKILDTNPEVIWAGGLTSRFPFYRDAPVSLQLIDKTLDECLDTYLAAELLRSGMSIADITYRLGETAPLLVSHFENRGMTPVPTIYNRGTMVEKVAEVHYNINFSLLEERLQVSTSTFDKLNDASIFQDASQRRFISSIWFGTRYLKSAEFLRVCSEINRRWNS